MDIVTNLDLSLPLKNPILIFSLVLFIILFSPIFLHRIKIPHIVGLMIAGMIIGPYGLNLVLRDSSIVLFGTVGLQYIMFLAGLEIDISDLKNNRNKSISFGIFTFSIQMILGSITGHWILGFNVLTSVLLASMFASHTLVAYPILYRFGITKQRSVVITVGGTIITDTLALIVLAVIAGMARGYLSTSFFLKLGISIIILGILVLYVLPLVARWFLKNFQDNINQYIFVLAFLFLSAFLAEVAGVEPIIGSFLAGLALNRLIPHTSPLMNRIEFVGNAIFIPFFLIGVGMFIDFNLLFKDMTQLYYGLTITIVATLGKYLAAKLTQKIFRLSSIEGNMIFGLSNAHAAAAIAVIVVGFNIILGYTNTGLPIRLLDQDIVNGAIIMIFLTCTISSFVVEHNARKLAIRTSVDNQEAKPKGPGKILIPVSNVEAIDSLIGLANFMKEPKGQDSLFALNVVYDSADEIDKESDGYKLLERAAKYASSSDSKIETIIRYDLNVASGIIHTMKEKQISEIICGIQHRSKFSDNIFGSIIDQLLNSTRQMIVLSKNNQPLNTIKKLIIIVPHKAEYEFGFVRWFFRLKNLTNQLGADIHLYSAKSTLNKIMNYVKNQKINMNISYFEVQDWSQIKNYLSTVSPDDLFIIVSSRKYTISYSPEIEHFIDMIQLIYKKNSYIIIYPEQGENNTETDLQLFEQSSLTGLIDRIQTINAAGRKLKRLVSWNKKKK
jgi:Kef-type K+ transport system membrane component KefB